MLKRKKMSYQKWAYIFLVPFFATFLIFQLYPMVYSIYLGFTNNTGFNRSYDFVGWKNFVYLWNEPNFWRSFINTFLIFTMNFVPQIVAALFFAALFTNNNLKLSGHAVNAFRFIYFLPNILTATTVAVLFYKIFERQAGPVWQLFLGMGFINESTNFYLEAWPARIIVAFIQFWMWFGNSMIIYISAMKGIDPSNYEAAKMDGASGIRMFFDITLPLMKPIMLYSLITSLLGGLQMFDIPMLFLNGGPVTAKGSTTQTITMYIYEMAFSNERNYGIAASASIYLFILSLILSVMVNVLFKEREAKARRKEK